MATAMATQEEKGWKSAPRKKKSPKIKLIGNQYSKKAAQDLENRKHIAGLAVALTDPKGAAKYLGEGWVFHGVWTKQQQNTKERYEFEDGEVLARYEYMELKMHFNNDRYGNPYNDLLILRRKVEE